jgi:predicted DNA binding CopG/RHH family protein
MKKRFPDFQSDDEAERFVAEADLSQFDFSDFRPAGFEFAKKTARINMRLPEALLAAIKRQAAARGLPYQRLIREILEQAVRRSGDARR